MLPDGLAPVWKTGNHNVVKSSILSFPAMKHKHGRPKNRLEQLLKLQAYVGEYNVPCEAELVDDDLVVLMYSGARYVIDDKMLTALQTASGAYDYARDAVGGRFELGESAIATNAYYSYSYARDAIGGRFELGEPAIAADASYAYYYARDIIKGRFELGEPAIAKDAHWVYWYACDVIGGQFEQMNGDPNIKN
jgi:hypothetical protein